MYAPTFICCSRLICNSVYFPNTPRVHSYLHSNQSLSLSSLQPTSVISFVQYVYPSTYTPILNHGLLPIPSPHLTSPHSPPPSFSHPLTSPHLPHPHLPFHIPSPHLTSLTSTFLFTFPHLSLLIYLSLSHSIPSSSCLPTPHLTSLSPTPSPSPARCAPSPPART